MSADGSVQRFTCAAEAIQRIFRGWAAREGGNGMFIDFAVRARASAAARLIQRTFRGWAVLRVVQFPPGFHFNRLTSLVPNGVPIEVAVRHFFHALATRRATICGFRANAGTAMDLHRRNAVRFATYKSHRDEPTGRCFNYAWNRFEYGFGSVPVVTPEARREKIAAASPRKKRPYAKQPGFITRDVLSVVAKFLPVSDWAALCCICTGSGFSLSRTQLRAQMRSRLGYFPSRPYEALLTYSAARSLTDWRCTRTVVFSWTVAWANHRRHGLSDRIVHLWAACTSQVHFITRQGMCGTYVDRADSIVNVSRMASPGSNFCVQQVAIGRDGCICVLHNTGLTTYSNLTRSRVAHVQFANAHSARELACLNERNVCIVYGRRRELLQMCTRCPSAHMRLVGGSGHLRSGASMMKATRTAVVWRAGHMRLCRLGMGDGVVSEILPRIAGRGRIVYISDTLPSGVNAVVCAMGPRLTGVSFTDGTRMVRHVDLRGGVPMTPTMRKPFSTAGDMVIYSDKSTRQLVAIRPETDATVEPRPLAFARVDTGRRSTEPRAVYLVNNAVFVVEDGRTIVKYLAAP